MNMFELINLLSSKDGDELFEKVKEILSRFGITVYNEDGSVKDLYTVVCEVAEVINNNTK
jgi:hypothetical protein